MPDTFVHAYPWDFEDDPAAAERAAAIGVDGVALAASYHATRAARPAHPGAPLVDASSAACYVPVRPAAWAGRRLVPKQPTWTSQDAFATAGRALRAVGLQPHAWVVLTHNSQLGAAHPDLVVRNAFGTGYPYALCPSSSEVVEYCATLIDEIVLGADVDGLVLEACGPMGFEHNGLHEKTSLAGWDRVARELLSLCFCHACSRRYGELGVDVPRLRELVRTGVRRPAESVEHVLGEPLAAAVTRVRSGVTAHLRGLLVERARAQQPAVQVRLHATADQWQTGSFATVAPDVGTGLDGMVASCFDADAGAGELAALAALRTTGVRLGALVRPTPDWADGGVRAQRMRDYRRAGMDELHLYHLGLVGPEGLRLLTELQQAFGSGG